MKQFNINPNERNEFYQSAVIEAHAPDDYKRYALHHLKEQVGMQLYNILEQCKNPIVVELIEEEPKPIYFNPHKDEPQWVETYQEEFRIRVITTPVQYRDVVIPRLHTITYDYRDHRSKFRKLLDRLFRK